MSGVFRGYLMASDGVEGVSRNFKEFQGIFMRGLRVF